MKPQKPFHRFLLGAGLVLVLVIAGFTIVNTIIPTWGSTTQEMRMALPGDDAIPNPNLTWDHALTIHAPAEVVYPWLVQIGDSRAAFYSITFIENAFCATSGECRYVNADRIHPEWQTPEKGKQGIIVDYMVIQDYQAGSYVLAVPTEKLPLQWTWLWYVQPIDESTSRLIVRHRIAFPPDAPKAIVNTVFSAGFIMERGMMLGIQSRAEGIVPGALEEPLGAVLWLLVFGMGVACAIRFIRIADGYHPLGVGLEAVAVLFILTYIQPAILVRVVLTLLVAAGVYVAFRRKHVQASLPLKEDLAEGR
ncbi:MAG TPA: hypothetical protein VMT46_18130 [Anaerolineaceae bacterium]|nr:hypothetical protein [Anaerolineaceae bacterium]